MGEQVFFGLIGHLLLVYVACGPCGVDTIERIRGIVFVFLISVADFIQERSRDNG